MPIDSATYHSLLNDCIDPDGPVHWLTADFITVTGLDGGAIVIPLISLSRLDPALAVAIRLRLTPLNMVITEPKRDPAVAYADGATDTSMLESA
jgi:hypothetical protein